jgi:phosphopantothenoylcysteine decarboxylase/phosphopantothenate--cysteine ligase
MGLITNCKFSISNFKLPFAMRCIVTAGPTYEPLDQMRRLTNASTGRLGIELANFLVGAGHEVTLFLGEMATWAGERRATTVRQFSTTQSLLTELQKLAGASIDAVFHAAAVSDFTFGKIYSRAADGKMIEVSAGKLSTREGGLLAELKPTPKIIAHLRDWFPKAVLVGWKYEVDGKRDDVIAKARAQIDECHTNACVANGPAYGLGFGLVAGESEEVKHLRSSQALFEALAELLPAT